MRKWTVLIIFTLTLHLSLTNGRNPVKNDMVQPQIQNTVVDLRAKYHIPKKFGQRQIERVLKLSAEFSIPEHIAFNLIREESRFDSTVVSKRGAKGYLQLLPKYFTFVNSDDNLRQGFKFLRQQFDRLGTWRKAVNYYNSGHRMCARKKYLDSILNETT